MLEPFGWRPSIRPIRGQIALLHPDRSPIRSLILCGKRYMVPRLDGRILVGSTEEDVGFDTRTTATAIADLIEFSETLDVRRSLAAGAPLGAAAGPACDPATPTACRISKRGAGLRQSLCRGGTFSRRHSDVAGDGDVDGGIDDDVGRPRA